MFRTAYIQIIECYYNYQSLFYYLFEELHVNVHFIFLNLSVTHKLKVLARGSIL